MWPHSSTERANERIQRSLRFVPPGLPRQLQARIAEPLASAALVAACPERHPFPSDAVMTDWQEALDAIESLVAFAYEQGFHELGWKPEKVVRAHIEGLEAHVADRESEIDVLKAERARAEARVQELEAKVVELDGLIMQLGERDD